MIYPAVLGSFLYAFWDRAARELPWFKTWDRVFEWTPPSFRWFIGGETNLCHSALDHQVARGRGDHVAMLYFNERGARAALLPQLLAQQLEEPVVVEGHRHHAVFTDTTLTMLQAETSHRGHAIVEHVMADLKNGPLAHLPSVILSRRAEYAF